VLVLGETGTGKELVARALHEQSPRRAGPFVTVHCAALPESLLESELFGYEKGAFTGATSRKPGRVELAEGGTLFLDEIGELTPQVQVKLLRLLQSREYERLGGGKTLRADVRFVAATHRDLEAMVARGEFREDLYYRLSVVPLWLPPLRERREDIEALAVHFCALHARANGRTEARLQPDALAALAGLDWPGNVRQLENFVERLVVLSDGPLLTLQDVQRELERGARGASDSAPTGSTAEGGKLDDRMKSAEREALIAALSRAGGNRTLAARLLGVGRRTLYYKLEEHGLTES
jgi:two-component system response regulator AtoC